MFLCNDCPFATSLCIYTYNHVCNSHDIFSHASDLLVTVGTFRLNSLLIVIALVTIIPLWFCKRR